MSQPSLTSKPPMSNKYPGHHAIFDSFIPFSGSVEAGFNVDYIGTMTHGSFIGHQYPNHNRDEISPLPEINEEYFEWLDILQSVTEADGKFTILELGAGYGRWAAIGAVAARSKSIKTIYAIMVEAEPKHVEWAHQHMKNNRFTSTDYHIDECAVGAKADKTLFWVCAPAHNGTITPQGWYGQSIVQNNLLGHVAPTQSSYMGKPLVGLANGWGAIEVNLVPLADILSPHHLVDIVDMDIQGAEAEVIENGIDVLNQKVRRLHIGTHTHEIENRIRAVMTKHNWINIWDFACEGERDTPYGRIVFQDGVQSWLNPRLPSQSNKPIEPPAGIKLF